MPGEPFVKGDPRINRKGRAPGPLSMVRSVLQSLGPEGRQLFGTIWARVLLTMRLEFPSKEDLLALGIPAKELPKGQDLTVEQYLKVVQHFCPTGKEGGKDSENEGIQDLQAMVTAVKAANE